MSSRQKVTDVPGHLSEIVERQERSVSALNAFLSLADEGPDLVELLGSRNIAKIRDYASILHDNWEASKVMLAELSAMDAATRPMPIDFTDLAAAILDLAREREGLTFVELIRILDKRGFRPRGDSSIELKKNVIAWTGMSTALVNTIRRLVRDNRLHFCPCSYVLTYFVDGEVLTLPVARRVPKNGYARPHWLPVVMNLKPVDAGHEYRQKGSTARRPQS